MRTMSHGRYIINTGTWWICVELVKVQCVWTLEWAKAGTGRAQRALSYPTREQAIEAAEAIKHALESR